MLPVEWQAVDAAADAAQPVSSEALDIVGAALADRARTAALEANRRGAYDEAATLLARAAADIRLLGPGLPSLERLAAELERERREYGSVMDALALKSLHFANYSSSRARTVDGRPRRRRTPESVG